MGDQIVTKDHIRAKARRAFERGARRDDHGFNWHAPALAVWQEEWDRCAEEVKAKQQREVCHAD